jgi:hypothetical protein
MNISCTLKGKTFSFSDSKSIAHQQFKYHSCELPKSPLENQSPPIIPNIFSDFHPAPHVDFRLAVAMLQSGCQLSILTRSP